MAYKVSYQTGNFSTAATWNSLSNTPTLHASTDITISNSVLYSATFTAPNTTNASTGCVVYLSNPGASGTTITATLYENSVSKAAVGATATCTSASIQSMNGTWLYFKWTTPFVYTATTAGYYKIGVVNSSSSTTCKFAADSGGSNFAYFATDDRTGAPSTGDDIWVVGNNGANAVTVTVDGTAQVCGSRGATTLVAQRVLTNAVNIGMSGILKWDTAASALLTCRGNFSVYPGSTWRMDDGAGGAYPTGKIATLTFSPNATGDHGFGIWTYATVSCIGEPKTTTALWRTRPNANWAIGQGVAGNEVVTAATVNWAVNDQIVISPTAAVAQTEYRYIKTAAGGNTFTLSTTAGGAEAGLTYAHSTSAWVLNITRNVVITTDDTATPKGIYGYEAGTTGYVTMSWVRGEYGGNTTSGKQAMFSRWNGNYDYSVSYKSTLQGLYNLFQATSAITTTGFIFSGYVGTPSGNYGGIQLDAYARFNLSACYVIDCYLSGLRNKSINSTHDDIHLLECNVGNSSSGAGISDGSIFTTTTNFEIEACRTNGIYFFQSVTGSLYENGTIGNVIKHTTADINNAASYFIKSLLTNVTCNSTTPITGYTSALPGSTIAFQNFNGTAYNNIVYTSTGQVRCCGAGLTDTETRTAGNHAIRLSPTDATYGATWTFYVVAKANSAVPVYGFYKQKTATPLVINLYKSGSTTPDYTQTIAGPGSDATSYSQFFVTVTNATAIPELYKVECKSLYAGTVGVNDVYITDIFNGTNDLGGLNIWQDGLPASIIYDQLGDSAAVWSFAIEDGLSSGDLLRIIMAAVAGKSDSIPGGPVHCRDVADTKNRITATVDANGNRTAITLDGA